MGNGMALSLDDPDLYRALERLGPYVRFAVERAARFAHRLHADELTVEHLLASLFLDEDCAATRAVLHAFADPETLATEVMALCPGILVVGSKRCVPFSVLGVRALFASRSAASRAGEETVEPARILAAGLAHLEAEALAALRETGLRTTGPPTKPAATESGHEERPGGLPDEGALFRHFSKESKRVLGRAGHIAVGLDRDAVSPAHLVLACLEVAEDVREASGLTAVRARMVLAGRDGDDTSLEERHPAADAGLLAFLSRQPEGADTLAILASSLEHGSTELRQLLARQRITTAVAERSRGIFQDPAPPPPAG
ncbi:MAG: Clp protease N-terminal domain-containing protein [Planctomycetota bacterium]|nr:Clp protease N-terminal domain-containing protein [Planctomycetota bacterium]